MHRSRVRQQTWPAISAWAIVVLLTAGVARAAEEGGGGFNPGDLGQAIIAIAIFLLLLLVLGKFAWGPIIAQLRSREDRIGQSITQAERREKQAAELLAQYQAKMENAQEEVERLLAAAREQAEEHRQALIAQARQEAERSVRYARHEIDLARDQAMQDMRETTARMAVELAEGVLRREIAPDDQDRLLRETLEEIHLHAAEEA